ncbi:MAG: hypothetical protein MK100_08880 [Phycisphaerales bacterium]|nr:hypothetical protein [Phycisphaerales bacterium]
MSDVPATRRDPETAPTVYLVNPDSAASTVDLQAVLAPLWRWRWVELVILMLSVLAAGWIVSRTPEARLLVIDCGHFEPEIVGSHLESVVIPAASRAVLKDWHVSPRTEQADVVETVIDQENTVAAVGLKHPQMLILSYLIPTDESEDTILNNRISNDIEDYFDRLAAVAQANGFAEGSRLKSQLKEAESNLEAMRSPSESAALRTGIDQHLARIASSIDSQKRMITSLQNEIAHAESLGNGEPTTANPDSRAHLLNLKSQLGEALAAITTMEDQRANFELEAVALAPRQNAENAYLLAEELVTTLAQSVEMHKSQLKNRLSYQPPTVIDAFDRKRPVEHAIAKFAGIILAGFFAAIFAAYALEALRLARLGAARS